MKKIFLLFGIAAFSSATAQQKDLFDIQKHLQKIVTEGKKKAEKKNFFLPFNKRFTYADPYSTNKADLSYSLPNGDKVVILGQDNMPCIKPDISQFHIMPNLATRERFNFNYSPQRIQPGQIPNGSTPFRTIASK